MRFRIKDERRGRIVPFSEALMSGLDEYELKDSFYMEKLRAKWDDFVGDIISTHSLPDRVFKNILFISVDHSIFANELSMMKDSILRKINDEFGFEALRDIRISVKKLDWAEMGKDQ